MLLKVVRPGKRKELLNNVIGNILNNPYPLVQVFRNVIESAFLSTERPAVGRQRCIWFARIVPDGIANC